MLQEWPKSQVESPEDKLNIMGEKAKEALKNAIIEKIKNGSHEEAASSLEDLLTFGRIESLLTGNEYDEANLLSAHQEQLDEMAQKYGVADSMYSAKEFRELASQVK